MGLFSKFTEKKECGICGKELGLLGKSKAEDGCLCKECAAKLSPFFTERRHTTLEDIHGQLECREENRNLVERFRPQRQLGDTWRLLFDDTDGWLVVTRDDDWRERNADVISYDSVEGADVRIDRQRHELTYEDDEGHTQRYNPPRYEEEYDFYLTIRLRDIPYINRIDMKLNTWEVRDRFSSEYDRYERMAADMRDALRGLCAGSRGAVGAQASYGQPSGQTVYGQQHGQTSYNQRVPQAGYAQQPQQPAYAQQPAPSPQPPKFCPNCGAPTTGGRFCESCGNQLV